MPEERGAAGLEESAGSKHSKAPHSLPAKHAACPASTVPAAALLELDEGTVFPPCKGGSCEYTAMWEYVCSP